MTAAAAPRRARGRRGVLAVVVAWSLAACGGETPAAPAAGAAAPRADLATLRSSLEAEQRRLGLLAGRSFIRRFPEAAVAFATRSAALARWVADHDALADFDAASAPAARARVLEQGETLAGGAPQAAAAADLVELLAARIERVYGLQGAILDRAGEITRRGGGDAQARVDAWNAGVAVAEQALRRSLEDRLAGKTPAAAPADGPAINDAAIAYTNYGTAETEGETLFKDLDAVAGAAIDVEARRSQLDARIAWAERVAAMAKDKLSAGALAELDRARTFLASEATALVETATKAVAAVSPARAREASAAWAAAVDPRLEALTRAFLEPARAVGLGDPPK
ncbi:MAG TPA: hypothetical protein VEI02_07120 [Planctomycetota bacterium]|nr:hypothetical protein [Planctomycetota bacterium]